MHKINRIIAYGDCNTLGIEDCKGNAYPEIVSRRLNIPVLNLGCTMSTTRELLRFFEDFPPNPSDVALLQYGLVDSWLTLRHAPYVLYYPDNPFRKALRKTLKKIKKISRTINLNRAVGESSVVPLQEYVENIRRVIIKHPETLFFIISTPPNLEKSRNQNINKYNNHLKELSSGHSNAIFIDAYNAISSIESSAYFPDGTHLNRLGHEAIGQLILEELFRRYKNAPVSMVS